MKNLLIFLFLAIINQSAAQVVTTSFKKIKNQEVQDLIIKSENRLALFLSRTGFTDTDSVNMLFNYRNEYVLVTHNLQDPKKIDQLFRNILVHCMELRSHIQHYKIAGLRIFVQYEKNIYLFTDLDNQDFTPQKIRMPIKEFQR